MTSKPLLNSQRNLFSYCLAEIEEIHALFRIFQRTEIKSVSPICFCIFLNENLILTASGSLPLLISVPMPLGTWAIKYHSRGKTREKRNLDFWKEPALITN